MSGFRRITQSSRTLSFGKTETKDQLSLKNKIGVKIETDCLASFRAICNRSKARKDSLKSLVQDRRG
jgi:DNA topoisomerase VI subunit A